MRATEEEKKSTKIMSHYSSNVEMVTILKISSYNTDFYVIFTWLIC